MHQDRLRLNEHRRRVFADSDAPIVFLCECSDPACLAGVPLTPDAYDERRPGPVVAASHRAPQHELQLVENEPIA